MNDRERGYRELADELIDYAFGCASRGIAPLVRDMNVYLNRLHRLDGRGTGERRKERTWS